MRKHIFLGLAFASLSACMSGPPRVYDFNTIPRDRISDGMTRRFVMADKSTMAIYDLKRGASVPVHTHDSEQLTYVLQGAMKFLVGGEEITVREGEVLHIPSWVPHQAEAIDDTFEMDIFSPIRQDWLDGTDNYFHEKK